MTKAKAICGCYRRDEAQDPEIFSAALAVVLEDYPDSVVEYVADPRTGVIKKFPMGLPSVGQIAVFLDDTQARQARIDHYSALPKFQRAIARPFISEPNLFVSTESKRYEEMVKMREKEPERARFEKRLCADAVVRDGIWVPLEWWEAVARA